MSSKMLIRRQWDKRVVRFASVGIINTLTDTAILNSLVFAFGMKLLAANIISASISIVLSYFWNHYVVFQKKHPMSVRLFSKFVFVTGLSILAIQSAVIYIFEHIFTLTEIHTLANLDGNHAKIIQVNGAKVIAVAVGMVFNFMLYQHVVFRNSETKIIIKETIEPL